MCVLGLWLWVLGFGFSILTPKRRHLKPQNKEILCRKPHTLNTLQLQLLNPEPQNSWAGRGGEGGGEDPCKDMCGVSRPHTRSPGVQVLVEQTPSTAASVPNEDFEATGLHHLGFVGCGWFGVWGFEILGFKALCVNGFVA